MKLIEMAKKLRPLIVKAAQSLTDEEAGEAPLLFDEWKSGVEYEAGYKARYGGVAYRCLMTHTAQDGWEPNAAPSLWTKVLVSETGEILPWEQPESTNAYTKGDRVTHNSKTWVSDVDGNVWEPGIYGWSEVR